MFKTAVAPMQMPVKEAARAATCQVAVLWIDWYAYHLARFQGLLDNPELAGAVVGLEMVGGSGVHAGFSFRAEARDSLPIETLLADSDWQSASQLRLARETWRKLHLLQPQVMLVPGYYTLPALTSALWAKLHGRKSVLMTESTEQDHRRVWWKERLKGWLICRLFDWAVTGGNAHVSYLRKLGFRGHRIAHFYDVVDNNYYRTQTQALRRNPEAAAYLPDRFFLYVGRLAAEKNIDGLLRAYTDYRKAGGTWSLILAGGGPEEDALRELAALSGFEADIYFAGHRSTPELLTYYAFAQAFVLPSLREPWGLVVNEAMASGLPVVVSTRCGCARDLVSHGANGLVFDPSEEGALARCLSRMERLSPQHTARMRAESSARISAYSPDHWAREIARIASA